MELPGIWIPNSVIINAWKHTKILPETRNGNGAEALDEVELSDHDKNIDSLHDIEETEEIAEAPLSTVN